AVAKFVMRDRQHLGILRVSDGTITLEQLYFADEIRSAKEIKPSKRKIDKRELEMAAQLIDSFRAEWDPTKYEDTYRDDLMKAVEAKRKGKDVHVAAEVEEEEELPDLLTALRESIERSGSRSRARSSPRSRADGL